MAKQIPNAMIKIQFCNQSNELLLSTTCRIFLGFEFLVRNEKRMEFLTRNEKKMRKILPHKMMIFALQIYERPYILLEEL